MRLVVAVTGASGMPYALALLKIMKGRKAKAALIISDNGRKVADHELEGGAASLERLAGETLDDDSLDAWCASGSNPFDMIIVPCSMSTLSKVAHGISDTLITRAASVALKERRRLVVVPRETPLSLPMIKSMETLVLAGAVVLPAMPGFWARPKEVSEIVDFIAERCAASLGIIPRDGLRWKPRTR